jgi:single-strand DNA-binding protein
MAKDLNKVQMTGRLGADPEMRYTPQGHAVTTFRVASNRTWRTPEGETQEDTEWFRVVAWNRLAEICNQWLAKGSRVYVEGRMQTRQWQDQEGQPRSLSEVVASDVIILESRREGSPPSADDSTSGVDTPATISQPTSTTVSAGRAAPAANPRRSSPPTSPRAARVAALPRGNAVVDEEELPF